MHLLFLNILHILWWVSGEWDGTGCDLYTWPLSQALPGMGECMAYRMFVAAFPSCLCFYPWHFHCSSTSQKNFTSCWAQWLRRPDLRHQYNLQQATSRHPDPIISVCILCSHHFLRMSITVQKQPCVQPVHSSSKWDCPETQVSFSDMMWWQKPTNQNILNVYLQLVCLQ